MPILLNLFKYVFLALLVAAIAYTLAAMRKNVDS
jgi:hypothetical protein